MVKFFFGGVWKGCLHDFKFAETISKLPTGLTMSINQSKGTHLCKGHPQNNMPSSTFQKNFFQANFSLVGIPIPFGAHRGYSLKENIDGGA